MVLVLFALLVTAGVWAWFARGTSRSVRIAAFGAVAAGIALLMFAVVVDRLN